MDELQETWRVSSETLSLMEEALQSYWQFWPEKKGCGGSGVYRTKAWPWCLKDELIRLYFWVRAIASTSWLPWLFAPFSHSLSTCLPGRIPSFQHTAQMLFSSKPPLNAQEPEFSALSFASAGGTGTPRLCPVRLWCACLSHRSQMESFVLSPLGLSCFCQLVGTL